MRREVQLKPDFADCYPALMPGRWYAASAVAGMLHSMPRLAANANVRLLDPAHFLFRGGSTRSGAWAGLRTRRQDRHADLSLL